MTKFGSPGQTRTADKVINSHLLYRLSYWGTKEADTNCPARFGQVIPAVIPEKSPESVPDKTQIQIIFFLTARTRLKSRDDDLGKL